MTSTTKNTVPASNATFLTDLQNFLREEDPDRFRDMFTGFIASGGTHVTGAGLVHTPDSLTAYPGGHYITETGAITYPDSTTHIWVICHKDTTTAVTDWTRVNGTHYLFRNTGSGTLPALPVPESVILMKVTTAGGAVSVVEDHRTSNPLASRVGVGGVVRMIHVGPDDTDWKVFKPDGSEVDTTGTTTTGLQEAVDVLDDTPETKNLYIMGTGVINCSTTVTFPVLNSNKIYMDSGVLNFTHNDSIPGIRFKSMMNCDIELLGKIVYRGSGPCIFLKPEGIVETVIAITNSRFTFTTLDAIGSVSPSANSTGIEIDSSLGSTLQNRIEVMKMEVSGDTGGVGILIKDDGALMNDFYVYDMRGSNVGVKMGETTGSSISQNNLTIFQSDSRGTTPIGMQIRGGPNRILYTLVSPAANTTGIQLESDASGNQIHILANNAATPIVDNSDRSNAIFTQGRIAASVHRNGTNQTAILTNTFTKIEFTTENYDAGGAFDNATNYRWTPAVIGLANVSAGCSWATTTDQNPMDIAIYKNGTILKRNRILASGTSASQGPHISATVQINAEADFFEIFVRQISGGNRASW